MDDKNNVTSTEPKKYLTIPYILKGEFFEILKQEGEAVTVQCKKCPQKNVYRGSVKSTGNFHMHIKRKHPESLERLQELKLKSFMDRKIKIPERFNNQTLLAIINNEKNNKGHLPQVSPTNPVVLNSEQTINYDNQPINCSKKTKINSDVKNCSTKNTINIQYSNKNSNELLKHKSFSVPYEFIGSSNKVTAPSSKNQNFYKISGEANTCPLNKSTTNISATLSDQKNCVYQHQQNSTTNNNIPIAATLTAASMIMSPTQDILGRIDNHLKAVERQLHLRNQIETNRIYLDLAKFKYLHPDFAFQG